MQPMRGQQDKQLWKDHQTNKQNHPTNEVIWCHEEKGFHEDESPRVGKTA